MFETIYYFVLMISAHHVPPGALPGALPYGPHHRGAAVREAQVGQREKSTISQKTIHII